MNELLNNYLADLVVEYHKLQNFHWYVKGKNFFTIHAKLEELYDGINEAIDEVAENILINGGRPLANIKAFLAAAKIKEAKEEYIGDDVVFKAVLEDFEYLLSSAVAIKKLADQEENFGISSLMDNYIQQFGKNIWMIKQMSAA
ncbi:MAG: DNA starvation/stationary phase protection protein [Erysipelotrichaceae bacterium]|nr:DNA starvation/stationary phase protection protein [Erysipelotrichaceae bacterium]MDY5252729.1 DNA starvation/stationary phase protection protein [Erysipelotrichaceae bacterium]